jgi:hypothetical protein
MSHLDAKAGMAATAGKPPRAGGGIGGDGPERLWIPTAEASVHLGISRKTLFRLKKQGTLKAERHWSRKNPAAPSSDLLWHIQRCAIALGRV